MNRAAKVATVTAASLALTGALTAGTAAAASNRADCTHSRVDTMVDPATGKKERAVTVTHCSGNGKPGAGSGGLIFRDQYGNPLINQYGQQSSMSEADRFEFGHKGPEGSGMVYVKQTTRGMGGTGTLYEGYVTAAWAVEI